MTIAEILALFLRYAAHDRGQYGCRSDGACDCGFSAALKQIEDAADAESKQTWTCAQCGATWSGRETDCPHGCRPGNAPEAPSEAVPVEAGRTGNEPDYEGEDEP